MYACAPAFLRAYMLDVLYWQCFDIHYVDVG